MCHNSKFSISSMFFDCGNYFPTTTILICQVYYIKIVKIVILPSILETFNLLMEATRAFWIIFFLWNVLTRILNFDKKWNVRRAIPYFTCKLVFKTICIFPSIFVRNRVRNYTAFWNTKVFSKFLWFVIFCFRVKIFDRQVMRIL